MTDPAFLCFGVVVPPGLLPPARPDSRSTSSSCSVHSAIVLLRRELRLANSDDDDACDGRGDGDGEGEGLCDWEGGLEGERGCSEEKDGLGERPGVDTVRL